MGENETLAIMVNEEDHLRIQVLRSGLQLEEAWEQINAVDDQLEATLDFAFTREVWLSDGVPDQRGDRDFG